MDGIMNSLVMEARKASRDSVDCRRTINTLQAMGFSDDAFRRLHRQGSRMADFYGYSKTVQRFEDDKNNHRVHQRLRHVLLSCPNSTLPMGKSFLALAEDAFKLIPPV
jgi:hypothetical protein